MGYTLLELGNMSTEEAMNLSNEDFNKWKISQNRNTDINKISLKQMKTAFDQNEADLMLLEQKARVYKANRDIKVYLYEMMEATIKTNSIQDEYFRVDEENKKKSLELQSKREESLEKEDESSN